MGRRRGAVAAILLALPVLSALLVAATPAEAPLECTQLETPEVEALASEFFSELLPLDGELFLPTPERDSFLDRGGQYCAWLAAASPLHIAYSPITEADADGEMARLTAAGLTRTETASGTAFELTGVPGFTLPEVWGRFLFADGYWYLVKSTTTGSGGTSVLTVNPAVVESIQRVVESELGPSTALAPDTDEDADPAAPPDPLPERAQIPFTADEPSVLSGLATASEVVSDPRAIAVGAGGALVLTALVAIPTALLNASLQEGYDRLRRRVERFFARGPLRRLASRTRLRDGIAIAIGLPLAAVITVFIDPRAGWNGGTARLLATTLAGFLIESLALLALLAWLLRRRGAAAHVSLRLGSLVILVLAVIATRLSGFEPGFVFGVVLAVLFRHPPTPQQEAAAARTELRLLAALAAASWLGYSAVYPLASAGDALSLLAAETMASVAVGGLTALTILALPVGETPGATLFRISALRWAAAFFGAVAAFCIVVLPMPESWDEVGSPFALWVGLFVAYSVLAVAVWAIVTSTRHREGAPVD